jgi:hypothetical protein
MNPFCDTNKSSVRLYNVWAKHKKLIVAVDFDDTLKPFTKIEDNEDYEEVWSVLRKCNELGFYVVLFTASVPQRYQMMLEWCAEKRIKIDSINSNPVPLKDGNNGKIYYNILLDDKAGLGQSLNILNQTFTRIRHAIECGLDK